MERIIWLEEARIARIRASHFHDDEDVNKTLIADVLVSRYGMGLSIMRPLPHHIPAAEAYVMAERLKIVDDPDQQRLMQTRIDELYRLSAELARETFKPK